MSKFINYAEVLYQNDKYITEDKIVRSTDGSKWSKQNIGIEVDGNEQSRNFIADPYFKIFDGINAANKSSDYTPTIEINGGNITINMGQGDTDALDSNGNLYINGGTLNITGQSAFDYDLEAKYSGGTMIVNGETTTTITNQFGGQMGGMMQGAQAPNQNMQGQQRGSMGGRR